MAVDPTQTIALRRRYNEALQRRIVAIQRAVQDAIRNRDLLGLDSPFGVGDIPSRLRQFNDLFQEQVNQKLLEVETADGTPILPRGTEWPDVFIEDGYVRGVTRANRQLNMFAAAAGLDVGAPIHVLRLQELFIQNFELLEGLSVAQAEDLRETLLRGMTEGIGAEEMARRIDNRIDVVMRNRARVIARTEVVRAHAEGTLDEFQRQGVGLVIPQVEFTTAGDIRVCVRCLEIASTDRFGAGEGVFPIQQARGIIPVHQQCRCTWLPAGFEGASDETNARMRRAARDRQRIEQLRTSPQARREQREASSPFGGRRRRQPARTG